MSVQTPAATITSLPNELLAVIAAAGQGRSRVPGLLPDPTAEWTLSHVSHRFRRVMIGSPALWTLIEADLHSEGSVEILGLYLERSQNYSLAVTLQHRSELREDSERELATKRLNQLVPHINRISWLRIAVQEWGGDLLLAPFRDLAAPILQHLEVVNLIDYYHWDPIALFSAGAPRIQFLKVYDQKIQLPASQWTSTLTHLELRRYHRLADLFDGNKSFDKVLAYCPSLIYLYLDMEWASLDHQVQIPSLQTLHITISESHELMKIIDIFDAPSLTELTIMGVHGFELFELFNSTSLPRASFPALASLCFVKNNNSTCYCERNIPPPPRAPFTPFQLFPALSSLSLINICFTSRIVEGVVIPTSAMCPILQTIALSPRTAAMEAVRSAVLDAMCSYLRYGRSLPTLRLSPALACSEDWQKHGIAVEKFDPTSILQVFLASKLKYA
ncbi:F-box domain-containing protein [Mycena sanguinolenta]|uniref:F-box domain-containing protein n=1 Tax=Mycena sanguinolenta TaxID=230812 RepID=A0A8H7CNM5_9AGAR|nr:F-box domain-containing protein [Mycena sanguinolenta]